MNTVFADTAFYIAFANPRDRWHEMAVEVAFDWRGQIVTTDYVLVEFGNHLCHPSDRGIFLRMVEVMRQDENTKIIPASSELLQSGLQLFGNRADKHWSLTDCISFALMQEMGITDALTCDRHFEQAGFRTMLIQ